ncbi:MAG TPA: SDR family oxidoreductase [Pilimelia sp.]|nr:SDR family oxidoreductase [Pilimelia sp.]
MTKILVTGATGNVGGQVVAELRDRGAKVRAFVRDPRRAAERLGGDVELAVGDFADPASVRRALQGVDRVFLACADGPQAVAHETAVVDAAAGAWVQRIVKLSTVGAEVGSPMMFADSHARVEEHLRTCPVPSVVLNAAFFMSNLFESAGTIRQTGQIFVPAGEAKIAMIDPRDVAAAVAVTLLDDGHDGRAYVLTGPEAITYAEVAAHLSEATGRPVIFVDVPDEAARAGLLESGAPDWFADTFVVLFGELRRGWAAQTTGDVRMLTGREPRGFADFARDHRAMFLP